MRITDEAIEAVAKFTYIPLHLGQTWEGEKDDGYKNSLRNEARELLEIAVPHLGGGE